MQKYVNCPVCGTKLLKAEEAKNLEMKCPKCRESLNIEITNEIIRVNTELLLSSDQYKNTVKTK